LCGLKPSSLDFNFCASKPSRSANGPNRFRLTGTPPPGALEKYKKGDTVGMIMLSAIWWGEDKNGKKVVTKELEYGRLTWEGFNVDDFYP
jgi:hypothetical protein